MNRIPTFLCLFILCLACNDDDRTDCSLVLCAGNDPVRLELLINGENALADRTYTLDNISVSGDIDEEFTIRVLTGLRGATEALLEVSDPDWTPGTYSLNLQLGTDRTIPLTAEFRASTGPCCGGFRILEMLSSPGIEVLDKDGFFTLVLE